MQYWINVAPKDHVMRGMLGGFVQANHGSARNLKRVKKGDFMLFYSPKETYEGTEVIQAFTGLGKITDDEPYQSDLDTTFRPFRRKVAFLRGNETPIRPLLDNLEFITDKQHWGYMFRQGLFAINEHDFLLIVRQMGLRL